MARSDGSLNFLIHHIFLPPMMLNSSGSSASDEQELLEMVHDALGNFRTNVAAAQIPALDRCIHMLGAMKEVQGAVPPKRVDVFGQQMVDLEEDGCLALYMDSQNAGLLVTRTGSELRFESLGLLAPDHIVMGCEGRLRRCFPTRTVAVARSRVIDPVFLQPFLDVFAELIKMREASRDALANPELVNDMVMGVLRGIGRSLEGEATLIYKHVREEALKEDFPRAMGEISSYFWRRSPLWLLLRVALQLTLDRAAEQHDGSGGNKRRHHRGRPLYKAIMIVLMSCVLQRAVGKRAPHHLLFFMKAKISQRLLKLGPAAAEESWYEFPCQVLHCTDRVLTERWTAIQSKGAQALPISQLANLDFDRDSLLSLDNLKLYLAWITQRKPMDVSSDGGHDMPFHRTKKTEVPRGTFSGAGKPNHFELFDLENWAESYLEKHTSPGSTQVLRSEEDDATGSHRNSAAEEGGVGKMGAKGPVRGFVEGHSDSGVWQRHVDNAFARNFCDQNPASQDWQRKPSWLCEDCRTMQPLDDDFELFVSPATSWGDCELCEMLYHALWPRGAASNRPVCVRREGTNLWADGRSRPILRLCVGPEWKGDSTVQVGSPGLLERSSVGYYQLLRSWLRHCDENHGDFGCHIESETPLPTRVIDVGDEDELRLVCTGPSDRGRYLALSHRWGTPSDEERRRNCTFADNLEERCRRISLAKLGKTFQDAVQVTRTLGERYLWIDSLCIIQDDSEDWVRESRGMEAIFSSAYCIIAATAAEGTYSGFLNEPPPTRSVTLYTPSGDPLHLCATVDDFGGDVEDMGLSRRGWVLQERALARRTIHFSASQTYWECGRGIHCETLSLLNSKEASFLGDPRFPKFAMAKAAAENASHGVFQVVFERYSRLELTYDYDRPTAIAGLECRLAKEMASPVAFGVFANFGCLHRSLLWRRADSSPLQWIKNPHAQVPTWSWMAYTGSIDYLDPPSTGVEWGRDIALETTAKPAKLTAPITAFTAEMMRKQSVLIMDNWTTADFQSLKCVVVGRELPSLPETQMEDEAYHILVVSLVQSKAACPEYERVGVATVQRAHLALECGSEPGRII